ncbi:hypothetical protein BK648_24600 [Pseudomonas poae]|uniref:DUF1329 domain-containing protein n=1 Tax=Pseudomonas poae TaxID=200451 RepID=A0A423ERK9_9PSED|nr:DUF1329 domain-containing protein [Pseudomonas poae]ROM33942.1 hypothetical protein BK648_24600 [Pseudomonas poae]
MINRKVLAVGVISLAGSMAAVAAVSPQEAAALGADLTPFGAIKAGNADGSIPAYTGGQQVLPGMDAANGKYVDPFANEKPLYRITAENMAQYGDKLSDGLKQLLTTQKDYYLDIYPTHRTMAYPDKVLAATKRNATECKTFNEGVSIAENCRGGIPFPVPKTGNEAMWNKVLSYWGDKAWESDKVSFWMITQEGTPVLTNLMHPYTEKPYYQVDRTDRPTNVLSRVIGWTQGPARKSGEINGTTDYLDPVAVPRKAWQYTVGQRRVKLAPEFSYDTPMAPTGGTMFYDELFLFDGKQDRFDFKLVGRREMFMPVNNYKVTFGCTVDKLFVGTHMNPDCERWELRRVWEVEATLKPGMRHANSKRHYYWEEDGWASGLLDGWDQAGKLNRFGVNYSYPVADVKAQMAPTFSIYNFNRGTMSYQSDITTGPNAIHRYVEPKPERELSPESITSGGLR